LFITTCIEKQCTRPLILLNRVPGVRSKVTKNADTCVYKSKFSSIEH